MNIFEKIEYKLYNRKRVKHLVLDRSDIKLTNYGSSYGGFSLVDERLDGKDDLTVYSFGIGEDLSFSEAVMERFHPNIYAFDPTPRAVKYVSEHKLSSNDKFTFEAIGLSDKDEETRFFLPVNEAYVSGSAVAHKGVKKVGIDVKMECLATIVARYGHKKIDVLKMDIEGSEFAVFENMDVCPVDIGQICLEIHDRFFDDGLKRLQDLRIKMKKLGYELIFVSESGEELTFYKMD